MMTVHLHGNILTQYGIAANNRGETEGNITTLQKILWKGELHSTVSAEAIRFAMRYRWQQMFDAGNGEVETNRTWNDAELRFAWKDPSFSTAGVRYIDDDMLGFMDAKAAAKENEDVEEAEASESKSRAKKASAKGTTKARRGPLEVTRAVSLLPFLGETSFSAKGGEKNRTSLYGAEMHATAYQYGFSLTPIHLCMPERIRYIIDALVSLGTVGGNHGRFLYDFSPQSIILRLTPDPAPRILYSFTADNPHETRIGTLVEQVDAGDLKAEELVLAGRMVKTQEAEYLVEKGAHGFKGILEAADYVKAQLRGE
ncbi:MAG: DevR family CRISPR-associated autoregulator [Desulfitobacteriaceae bacterium]